ncbi:uncharacterized protein IL334_003690 [Kwoniella shivajii]|uniref:Uncharacterized protein n=1 Tax=Kwoniella shivajii TaxID=564305 RepID=A0ABZ1CY96_9TREE|nr:hypothetical protein IL334_003690 [Kwoniella shivajii]
MTIGGMTQFLETLDGKFTAVIPSCDNLTHEELGPGRTKAIRDESFKDGLVYSYEKTFMVKWLERLPETDLATPGKDTVKSTQEIDTHVSKATTGFTSRVPDLRSYINRLRGK